jgi:hypothetical protein
MGPDLNRNPNADLPSQILTQKRIGKKGGHI